MRQPVASLCCVHGTLAYFDVAHGCLRQAVGLDAPANAGLIIEDGLATLVYREATAWMPLDGLNASGQIGRAPAHAAPLRFRVHRMTGGTIGLEANGAWLCAEADGTITLARHVAGPWESFLPLTSPERDFLTEIAARDWISANGRIVSAVGGIGIERDFRVRVGLLNMPLTQLLDARHRCHRGELTIVYEHWKVERLRPFRPLVYFIAYGKPEIFDTLFLALTALREFGAYTGDIMVFTDRTLEQLSPCIPPGMVGQVRVGAAPVRDVLDMMSAKYRIQDMPEMKPYAPFLYLDADVICNQPVADLLMELSRADRISLPLEMDLLGSHNYYGAVLFGFDPSAVPRHERGFSAGLMGVPSLDVAQGIFPTILDCLYGLTGRQTQRSNMHDIFHDQGIANYVVHKTDAADFEIMTRRVVTPVRFSRPVNEIPSIGFAHFCGGVGDAAMKLPSMRAYVEFLRSEKLPVA